MGEGRSGPGVTQELGGGSFLRAGDTHFLSLTARVRGTYRQTNRMLAAGLIRI